MICDYISIYHQFHDARATQEGIFQNCKQHLMRRTSIQPVRNKLHWSVDLEISCEGLSYEVANVYYRSALYLSRLNQLIGNFEGLKGKYSSN